MSKEIGQETYTPFGQWGKGRGGRSKLARRSKEGGRVKNQVKTIK